MEVGPAALFVAVDGPARDAGPAPGPGLSGLGLESLEPRREVGDDERELGGNLADDGEHHGGDVGQLLLGGLGGRRMACAGDRGCDQPSPLHPFVRERGTGRLLHWRRGTKTIVMS